MNRPIHFEIPADNTERAIEFYSRTFGWKFNQWDGPMPYWMIDTGADGPGINGGMMQRRHPNQPPVNTLDVADVDASLAAVISAGGTLAVPKMAIPGVGWLAYVTDTEGNIFGMMQSDSTAR